MKIPCPCCKHEQLKYGIELLQIPYFNEVLCTTISCDNCGYKHSDIQITSQNTPMEYKYQITNEDDLNVRVIRSSTATIEIPELDIKLEPASASEAFISNIEGVLVRMSGAVEYAIKFAQDEEKKASAQKLLNRIDQLRKGHGKATIIIKDPLGNSGIVSDKTEKRELTSKELEMLETGITFIDLRKSTDLP